MLALHEMQSFHYCSLYFKMINPWRNKLQHLIIDQERRFRGRYFRLESFMCNLSLSLATYRYTGTNLLQKFVQGLVSFVLSV